MKSLSACFVSHSVVYWAIEMEGRCVLVCFFTVCMTDIFVLYLNVVIW